MKRFRSLSFAFALLLCTSVAEAQPPVQVQLRRGGRTVVRGGQPERPDSLRNKRDSMQMAAILLELDSLQQTDFRTDSIALTALRTDDIRTLDSTTQARLMAETPTASVTRKPLLKKGWFMSDSMSLSKVCWLSTVLPGYGQIYNKQYWKLPILYGALGTGLALYIHENNTYKPLKRQYEAYTDISTVRTPELNALQTRMIRSNTRRQLYLGLTVASYIYFIGDAAVNYRTNDVSRVKKATTLACICPGAGQIYNRSYWKVPFVVGGFAAMVYCIDWNNRGYQRFKKAYSLRAAYDEALALVDFTAAVAAVQKLAGRVNLYVEDAAPWNLAKDETKAGELAAVIYNALEAIRVIALYLAPFMPNTSAEVFRRLGLGDIAEVTDIKEATAWGQLPASVAVEVGDPLFPRLDVDNLPEL